MISVPTSSPASARSTHARLAPPAISTGRPLAPTPAAPPPACWPCRRCRPPSRRRRAPSAASSTPASSAIRVPPDRGAGCAVYRPVDVGQQHQQVGVQADGDARRQPVVVAEADRRGAAPPVARAPRRYSDQLGDADAVVFVEHRHRAELQQAHQRRAQAQRAIAIGQILLRQQHLRGRHVELRERLGVEAMRCPCPTAAQACRSPSERGRSLSPSTRIPMPTAPLDTSTHLAPGVAQPRPGPRRAP